MLAGIYVFGQLLDAVSNAITLISLRGAIWMSVIGGVLWAAVELTIRLRPLPWRGVGGASLRITRFGPHLRAGLLGAFILLWIPQIIDWARESAPSPTIVKNADDAKPDAKGNTSPPAATPPPKSENDQAKTQPKAEPPKQTVPPATEPSPGKRAVPNQTMINSPGGIQAGGDVHLHADRRIVNTMSIRVTIETETPPTPPRESGTDFGLGSVFAIFTKDKTRIRFATDFTVTDHWVSESRRKLVFNYTPETPSEILGKPIEYLASVDVVTVNYTDLLKMMKFDTTLSPSDMNFAITVNGVIVGTIRMEAPPGRLANGQVSFNSADVFAQIPTAYERAVARQ